MYKKKISFEDLTSEGGVRAPSEDTGWPPVHFEAWDCLGVGCFGGNFCSPCNGEGSLLVTQVGGGQPFPSSLGVHIK